MMKRIIALGICVLMSVSFIGCNNKAVEHDVMNQTVRSAEQMIEAAPVSHSAPEATVTVSEETKLEAVRVSLSTPTVKTSNGVQYIYVKWNKIKNAKGYVIYRKAGKGKWKKIKTIKKAKIVSYCDKSVAKKNGTEYQYKVKAYAKAGKKTVYSKYSRVSKITRDSGVKTKVSFGFWGIYVKWNKSKGADGYAIYRKQVNNKKAKWVKLATVDSKTTKYVDEDYYSWEDNARMIYTYVVRPYVKTSKGKVYGAKGKTNISKKIDTDDDPQGYTSQEDVSRCAAYAIEILNQYRVEEGKTELMQGSKEMQAFANMRAEQISTNFAHDYNDTRECVKKLNYGEFWVKYNAVQPFQHSAEACCTNTGNGGPRYLARRIIDSLRASKAHWAYLGAAVWGDEFKYVAVGIHIYHGEPSAAIWLDEEWHTGPIYFD